MDLNLTPKSHRCFFLNVIYLHPSNKHSSNPENCKVWRIRVWCYCWWFRNPAITTWDVYNLVNHGITYQPQLVSRISSINMSMSVGRTYGVVLENSCRKDAVSILAAGAERTEEVKGAKGRVFSQGRKVMSEGEGIKRGKRETAIGRAGKMSLLMFDVLFVSSRKFWKFFFFELKILMGTHLGQTILL